MVDMFKLINSVKLKPVTKPSLATSPPPPQDTMNDVLNRAIMRIHDSLNPDDDDGGDDDDDEFSDNSTLAGSRQWTESQDHVDSDSASSDDIAEFKDSEETLNP